MTRIASIGGLLAGLLVAVPMADLGIAPPAGAAVYQPYGTVHQADRRLRAGCHNYPYRYAFTPPTDQWTVELFLHNPNGHTIASTYYDVLSDPVRGRSYWTICSPSTVPGRYRISIKVTYQDDVGGASHTARAKPAYFRLFGPVRR